MWVCLCIVQYGFCLCIISEFNTEKHVMLYFMMFMVKRVCRVHRNIDGVTGNTSESLSKTYFCFDSGRDTKSSRW